MTENTIAAGFAKAFIDLAVTKGASQTQLLHRSGIEESSLEDIENRIPLENYILLVETAKEVCQEPAIALHFGEMPVMSEMSIVYLICRSVRTVQEAFEQINRYSQLALDADGLGTSQGYKITHDEQGAWIELTQDAYKKYPQLTESGLARIISGATKFFQGKPFALAVHVTHDAGDYLEEYQRIFNTPITFNSHRNAILVDANFLSYEISPASDYVFGVLSKHADEMLIKLRKSKSIRGQVENSLLPILHTGGVDMSVVAERLNMSQQTLYRKLKAEGVNYEQIVDELKRDMALHYLKGEQVTIKETAYLLGFSEPSAFSRAFKRWTGSSPSKILVRDA